MAHAHTIGLDIAKEVFQVHGIDAAGKVLIRKSIKRADFEDYFRALKPCLIGIEGTGTAHHWSRILRKLGHTVRMMHTGFVKPYVKSNKNDAIDAEAICEAVRRPTMRFVPIKSIRQQGAITIHRTREALVRERKSLMLVLRSLLAEFGIVARRGTPGERATLEFAEASSVGQLPRSARSALQLIADEVRSLKLRIKACEAAVREGHKRDPQSQRIATIPNIGPVTASAVRAIVGDGRQFRSGREFSAWIGLVPRQYSSGGKTRLGHIPRGGNAYLRRLLYFAATAALGKPNRTGARVFIWARALRRRKPMRVTAIALASKLARIIWAILRDRCDFVAKPIRTVRA